MAFVLPTFNLDCDVYTFGTLIPGTPRLTTPAQLRAPSMQFAGAIPVGSLGFPAVCALFPPGTDIRDGVATPGNSSDFIDLPAGSGCWYFVIRVFDIAKGFPNEHRYAVISKATTMLWPVPMP